VKRTTYLRRQRAARARRAQDHGAKFERFLQTRKNCGWTTDDWLARHIGMLVQRVAELEARVARLEGAR
jgi:hypothetical protein